MRFWGTTFVFVLASAALLLTTPGRIEQAPEAAQVPGFICAIVKIGQYPGYCTYYAMQCTSSTTPPCGFPVPMNKSDCTLGSGNCCNPGTNCFQTSTFKLIADASFVELKVYEKGLEEPLGDDFVPKVFDNKILQTQIAEIETPGGGAIKAKLFQIQSKKHDKNLSEFIIGDGVEITTNKEPDLKIKNLPKTVTFQGKICYLNLGSVRYTVVLSKEIKAAPKDK
jgi:hypothetical protein